MYGVEYFSLMNQPQRGNTVLNYEQYMSALRWALATGGGYLIGAGYIDVTVWGILTSAVVSLAPLGWGMLRHTWANTLMAATEVPGTQKVVNPEMATLPSPKITAS